MILDNLLNSRLKIYLQKIKMILDNLLNSRLKIYLQKNKNDSR